MQPILASNFGNLGAFVLGVPALGLALLIGVPSVIFRVRALAVVCGVVCLLVGGLFLLSLSMAVEADRLITVAFSAFSMLIGAGLIFFKRKSKV